MGDFHTQATKQFDAENGGTGVRDGRWMIFANGAKRETNIPGICCPPPDDKRERARLVIRYHEVHLKRAMEQFDQLKKSLMESSDAWMNDNANIEELRQRQEQVKEKRKA